MSWAAILLIRLYQVTAGRIIPRVCRFEPTCSTYAMQAIRQYGLLKGGAMSAWRIVRCNPFCHGGWDPVPERMGRDE
ncbi:MAG: membrane protein insertion efficiency factor YidD [candidate division WOR-3 bacterium]|nr:MAG: membrane protein insertion efficiency factor YidD [candidate division WOR-3 bacterium]